MNWLGKIFGGLKIDVNETLDTIITNKEERMQLQNALQALLLNAENELQKNVTERWKHDMASDSWLSKNVRPLVLLSLVIATILLVFIDAGFIKFQVETKWVDLLQVVLLTVIGAYFGGRSFEKVKNTNLK